MKPRTGMHRRHGHDGEHGQMVILFALCLVAIIAVAGLLIDGGLAWSNRRQAQAAADTAALAAAKAIVGGGSGLSAAQAVANLNGFQTATDCAGVALPNGGVVVNYPPSAQSPHVGDSNYVEVITTRKMTTTFSGALGMSCWMVSARAVSTIGTASVAKCSFCSLNSSNKNHTLVLKNGATLRVDGDIYVNSINGGASGGCTLSKWNVCGDGFDIFGDGGQITAHTISVSGGWETHDNNPVKADYLAKLSNGSTCPQAPNPPSQTAPWLPSNVCIHMPQIADPLNDSATPKNVVSPPTNVGPPVAGVNGCPAGALIPSGGRLTITSAGAVICPGTYNGGIAVTGTGSVTMMAGIYYLAGGGFSVADSAAVNGTAGVMLYNTSGDAGASNTNPGIDLVPPKNNKLKDLKDGKLKATPSKNIETFDNVILNFEVKQKDAPAPTGVITFYNGQFPITGCENLPIQPTGKDRDFEADCTVSFSTSGTKNITSVYFGDTVYNGTGDTVVLNVAVAAGGQIDIDTTGSVRLYGPAAGPYKGLTIFQDRSSSATVNLHPGTGSSPGCGANWLTQDVPDVAGVDPPPACGAIGGLRGTIYAADPDALVFVTASGLANLQIISGKIQIDSDADARFAYTPQFFANGSIRLIE